MRHLVVTTSLAVCVAVGAQTRAPARGRPLAVIPANAAQLAALWQPMGGTPPPALTRSPSGTPAVRLVCPFATAALERASWDIPVTLDMAAAVEVTFQAMCVDQSPVSHFNIYFRSGNGWYAASWSPPDNGVWGEVRVRLTDVRVEGEPAGWGEVEAVRISAWRAANRQTELSVADFTVAGADAPVVIIRGDAVSSDQEAENNAVRTFTRNVARCLSELRIPFGLLSDIDVTAARLNSATVVILPHNPVLPEATAAVLRGFLTDGGRLITFYRFPTELADLIGMQDGEYLRPTDSRFACIAKLPGDTVAGMPERVEQHSWNVHTAAPIPGRSRIIARWLDDEGNPTEANAAIVISANAAHISHVLLTDGWPDKRRLMLALLGHFMPGLWEAAGDAALANVGRFAGFSGYAAAVAAIRAATPATVPAPELARAEAARRSAVTFHRDRQFAAAIQAAADAESALLAAWCRTRPALPGEFRAFWCHSAFGVDGLTWNQAVQTLAANGFTAVLPNMLWGGVAFYPTTVLPTYADLSRRGDQIQLCLDACRRHGVECHVWKVNFNMGSGTPDEFVAGMRAADRVQMRHDGEVQHRWLCPSHPENQALEIAAMVDVARRYPVDGIHFDYIRYPGTDYCYCDGCRTRFEQRLGRHLNAWPQDARRGGPHHDAWLQFRRDNITAVVAAVAEQARQARPGIKISAAVFRNYPLDRDGVAQDWKLWCERGYLDFICPMDYTEANGQFDSWVGTQKALTGTVPCYPGIGLSTWADAGDIVKLVEQIEITRKHRTGGFTIFNYDGNAMRILPLAGAGITRPAGR